MTHPRPFPGHTWWWLPAVEEGLGGSGEQRVLEEGTSPQAQPSQRMEFLTLEAVDTFRHRSSTGGTSVTGKQHNSPRAAVGHRYIQTNQLINQ